MQILRKWCSILRQSTIEDRSLWKLITSLLLISTLFGREDFHILPGEGGIGGVNQVVKLEVQCGNSRNFDAYAGEPCGNNEVDELAGQVADLKQKLSILEDEFR